MGYAGARLYDIRLSIIIYTKYAAGALSATKKHEEDLRKLKKK